MLIMKKAIKVSPSKPRAAIQYPENHETEQNWNSDCKAIIKTNFSPWNEMILNILVIS